MSDQAMVMPLIYSVRAAMSVANIVRSSLGPQGLDKMIVDEVGEVTITNDGTNLIIEAPQSLRNWKSNTLLPTCSSNWPSSKMLKSAMEPPPLSS